MTLEESLIEAVKKLPPEKQHELLEYAQRLQEQQSSNGETRPVVYFTLAASPDRQHESAALEPAERP